MPSVSIVRKNDKQTLAQSAVSGQLHERRSEMKELANQVAQFSLVVKRLTSAKTAIVEPAIAYKERIVTYYDKKAIVQIVSKITPSREKVPLLW